MKLQTSLMLAFRYLTGKRSRDRLRGTSSGGGGRAMLAVLGIGLSLVPLVVVLEVSDGMIQGITSRFIETGTYHLQLIPPEPAKDSEIDEMTRKLAFLPEVTSVYREQQGFGLLSSPKSRSGASVRGISPELWETDILFRRYIQVDSGNFDLNDPQSAVLGSAIAKDLGVKVGDSIKLLTVRSLPNRPYIPRISTFTVTGIVSSGYQDLDKLWMFISLERAKRVLPLKDSRRLVGLKVTDPFLLKTYSAGRGCAEKTGFSKFIAQISGTEENKQLCSTIRGIKEITPVTWLMYTWYDLEKSRYMSYSTIKLLLTFIMGLIVCVAAINISSSLVMMVMERNQEIAILKSIGASPRLISRSFIITGFFIGFFGTLLGIFLGILAALNVNEILFGVEWLLNFFKGLWEWLASPALSIETGDVTIFSGEFYLERIPINIHGSELFLVAIFSIALCVAASLLPARSAGKIKPFEVLRKY
jgi:lipoprotein-releasing system permease protein